MKIAFFVRVVPPAIDGVGDYTWHLVRACRDAGMDARLFTSAGQKASENWIYPVLKKWDGGEAARRILEQKDFRPDWCSFQYVAQLYGHAGLCWPVTAIPKDLKEKLNCRVAVTFHEVAVRWGWRPKDFFLAAAMRLQAKRLLGGCDLGLATCSGYGRWIRSLAPSKTRTGIIPVGSNIESGSADTRLLSGLRQKYGLDGKLVFGTFGRWTGHRRLSRAVRLLEEAKKRRRDAVLLVIGKTGAVASRSFSEGMELARRAGVQDKILSTGELSPEAVSNHLRLMNVFLYLDENGLSTGSGTVMAALAHGLPVAGFRGPCGIWQEGWPPVSACEPAAEERKWIGKVLDLCGPAGSAQDGSRNADFYEKNFSWKRVRDAYLEAMKGD